MHFNDIINAIGNGFAQFRFQDLLDILIIAFLIYKIIDVSINTRAYQLLKGLGALLIIMLLSTLFNMYTVSYLMNNLLVSGIVIVFVLFQPELRRGLAHIGGRFNFNLSDRSKQDSDAIVKELSSSLIRLSKRKVGALIVVERNVKLDEFFATGTYVDASISGALVENIFEPNTPLHDGAVIIRDGRIHYAACVLPLFSDPNISRELGTRHRAALGISAVSDCITLVVSEETGVISYADNGKLIRYLDKAALIELLEKLFAAPETSKSFAEWTKRIFKNGKKKQS
ncbi:MAG: diadenylate cyclase CdaA [Clostridia bacterium]|nr:diadenylate cyclase CdaA [Clostridia bacterium]